MSESDFQDLSTVESMRNDRTAEEFPDGAYGASADAEQSDSPTVRSARTGRPHSPRPYGYENKRLHQGMSRNYPGDQGAGSTD